jgi:parallel beta-helix repeat protein
MLLVVPSEQAVAGKKIVYVDGKNISGIEDGTSDRPFNKIQEGIRAASKGDTVLVAPGIYHENIDFLWKAIILKSEDGAAATKIKGIGKGDVVMGAQGCTIQGFTITGSGDDWYDSGINAWLATMTISENIITGNWLGIFTANYRTPLIQNNLIYKNTNYGISPQYHAAPIIVNNTIILNGGHGIFSASGTGVVSNNIIFSNRGHGIYCTMASASPKLSCNNVFKNKSGNYYNCGPGEGDISVNPMLLRGKDDNFHLKPGSPCVDMGESSQAPVLDFDLEPRPQGGYVDIGYDEYCPSGTIFGYVKNKITGLPVKGAMVRCVGLGKSKTDKNGYYGFSDVMDGGWMLKVRKIRYKRGKATVDVVLGTSVRQDFLIKPRKQ